MGLPAGRSFGPYRVIEPLGRGGMASVYKAYEAGLDRYVALKVLPGEFLGEETFAERFKREAKVVARLEHPNIIPIHAFGIEERTPWMAMRLISGGTLSTLLRTTRLSSDRVALILRGVANALDYAHSRGVVHRDVKPQNILLDEGERVYLADFGIAKMVEGTQALTMTGMISGTPQYMSPEQTTGQPVDSRADIYALGVVAYEMLTGRVPFAADTPVAVLMKHVSEPMPLPSPDEVSEPLVRALLKALAKRPEDRWGTAGEFVGALENAVSAAPLYTTAGGNDAEAPTRPARTAAGAMRTEGVRLPGTVPPPPPTAPPIVPTESGPAPIPLAPPAGGTGKGAYLAVGAGLGLVAMVAVAMAAFFLRGRMESGPGSPSTVPTTVAAAKAPAASASPKASSERPQPAPTPAPAVSPAPRAAEPSPATRTAETRVSPSPTRPLPASSAPRPATTFTAPPAPRVEPTPPPTPVPTPLPPTADPPTPSAAPRPVEPVKPVLIDKRLEGIIPYEVGRPLPFAGQTGSVQVTSIQLSTVDRPPSRFKKLVRAAGDNTTLIAVFQMSCPQGAGEWEVKADLELLDEKSARVGRFEGDTNCEEESKAFSVEYSLAKILVPLIRSVKVRLQASLD